MTRPPHTALLSLIFLVAGLSAQAANYDESKIPPYTLPALLRMNDGRTIATPSEWRNTRRPELLASLAREMYGIAPGRPDGLTFTVRERARTATRIRKQVTITCAHGGRRHTLDLLLYVPRTERPVPVFLGLNFDGNHTIQKDPEIHITSRWVRNRRTKTNRASAQDRGMKARRWPVDMILQRGYGLATIYYGEIDPDKNDFSDGVHPLFYRDRQTKPESDQWGAIAAWAWGLSRALDYLTTDNTVDAKRVAVVGHSRLGKTALWAGAVDQRFALTISNNSGCGGAALSRRRIGETVARINKVFPHWFCDNFLRYGNREDELPFDQHALVALVAPRPVLVVSATKDRWADPRGEFLAAKHAGPVFALFGYDELASATMPPPGKLVRSRVGYYLRDGKHDMTREDWRAYLDFADHHGLGPR